MESYDPSAIVLQCGTDSLSGDKLGCLNLSMRGHANCVKFVKSFNKPLLLLGGGGYTMRNVSRAWAYETGLAAGVELGPEIPVNEYYEYFGPDYELDVRSSNTDDMNTPSYLERVKRIVLENLRHAGGPPSVQMSDIPAMPIDTIIDDDPDEDDAELINPNDRRPMRLLDSRRQPDGELSDSEDEGEGGRRNHASYRERDTNGGHKFGIGGGILNSGTASTHGAGPSGHHTVVRMLSSLAADTTMDVDSPSTESGAGTEPLVAAGASDVEIKPSAGIHPSQSDSSGAPSEDNMALDPPATTAQ